MPRLATRFFLIPYRLDDPWPLARPSKASCPRRRCPTILICPSDFDSLSGGTGGEEPLGFQFRHEESPSAPRLHGYRNAGQEGLVECTQSWRTLRINIYNLDSRRPRVRRIRVWDCQTRFTVAAFSWPRFNAPRILAGGPRLNITPKNYLFRGSVLLPD